MTKKSGAGRPRPVQKSPASRSRFIVNVAVACVAAIVAVVVLSRSNHKASSVAPASTTAPALSPEQAHVQAHLDSLREEMRQEMQQSQSKAATPTPEDEYNVDGLVLLQKTLKRAQTADGTAVAGTVVNGRKQSLSYVQITFTLYGETGATMGSATATTDHLEPGGQWNFVAPAGDEDWRSFKVTELTGF